MPDETLLTEIEGPKGTAEIYEVATTNNRVVEVEYVVVFGRERKALPSMGEAHVLANQLAGLDEGPSAPS